MALVFDPCAYKHEGNNGKRQKEENQLIFRKIEKVEQSLKSQLG